MCRNPRGGPFHGQGGANDQKALVKTCRKGFRRASPDPARMGWAISHSCRGSKMGLTYSVLGAYRTRASKYRWTIRNMLSMSSSFHMSLVRGFPAMVGMSSRGNRNRTTSDAATTASRCDRANPVDSCSRFKCRKSNNCPDCACRELKTAVDR